LFVESTPCARAIIVMRVTAYSVIVNFFMAVYLCK
jgi:hypothetical protein